VMAKRYHVSRHIDAPVERVWALLTDASSYRAWNRACHQPQVAHGGGCKRSCGMAPSQDGIGGRSVERRLSSLGFSYHGRSGQRPGTAGSTGRHRDVSGAGNVDLPATMASYRPVAGGGWSGLGRRRPATLDARRSASALTAASEAATVCSQRRATSSHQRCPRSHRSAPISPS
jgi:hypothetical protein